MIERFTAPALSIAALFLVACVAGEIEGPQGSPKRRDAGAASGGGGYPGDDLPAPPPDDQGDDPAPPPPSGQPDAGAPAPPPAADSGGGGAPSPPPTAEYPAGPYGLTTGSVVPNLTLQGYRDGVGTWTSLRIADYYDPTGARGVKGVLFTVSAAWCGPCKEEAKQLVELNPGYRTRGAKFLTAMIEDSYRNPAKQSTVDAWISYAGTNFDIVADPESRLLRSGASLPSNFVVDPRTMKITKTWSGSDPYATSFPALDTVLTKNGG